MAWAEVAPPTGTFTLRIVAGRDRRALWADSLAHQSWLHEFISQNIPDCPGGWADLSGILKGIVASQLAECDIHWSVPWRIAAGTLKVTRLTITFDDIRRFLDVIDTVLARRLQDVASSSYATVALRACIVHLDGAVECYEIGGIGYAAYVSGLYDAAMQGHLRDGVDYTAQLPTSAEMADLEVALQ
jgi:hypothetical protein